jgi:hypothetical protein
MNHILSESVPGSGRPHFQHEHHLGSIDGFGFQLELPDNTDYLLAYDWPSAAQIAQLRITSTYGTGVCSVLINDVPVEGITSVPIAAGARSQHSATGLNKFGPDDDITLRIESGAGSLANVRGTLVISRHSTFEHELLRGTHGNLITGEIAIVGSLVGADTIPVPMIPPLHRPPIYVYLPVFIKNSPDEDNIYGVGIEPFLPNDLTTGWNYRLNGNAIENQVMRFAYLQ